MQCWGWGGGAGAGRFPPSQLHSFVPAKSGDNVAFLCFDYHDLAKPTETLHLEYFQTGTLLKLFAGILFFNVQMWEFDLVTRVQHFGSQATW